MVRKLQQSKAPLHFRRKELKYLVPNRMVPVFLQRIEHYTQPDLYLVEEDEGREKYPVTSLYFDSVDLQSLHEKESGMLSRRKIRLRTYHKEFSERRACFLEIKRRHDVVVSKDRLSLEVGRLDPSIPLSGLLNHVLGRVDASEEVYHEAVSMESWYNLQPSAIVQYTRIPRVGKQDRRFRITVDTNLCGVLNPSFLLGEQPMRHCLYGHSIIELKYNHLVPSWFHTILQELELVRISHSKYVSTVRTLQNRCIPIW